ncbi:MAG: hypothetical protein WC967_03120 [Balneolaceae bacterium]
MKANIRTISSLLGLIILLSLPGSLKGQTTGAIFKVVPNAKSALSVSEFSTYTDINKDPIKEKALINIIGLEQALQKSMVSVSLKGGNYTLKTARFSNTGEESFNFKGSFTDAMGELYLYQTNGYLYGNIHIDSLAYQIEPINKK